MGTLRTGVTNRNSPVRGSVRLCPSPGAAARGNEHHRHDGHDQKKHGVVQLLQFQGTTWSREIFVGFGPPTGRQLSFSRGITSEKVEPCTEPPPSLPRPVRRPR